MAVRPVGVVVVRLPEFGLLIRIYNLSLLGNQCLFYGYNLSFVVIKFIAYKMFLLISSDPVSPRTISGR